MVRSSSSNGKVLLGRKLFAPRQIGLELWGYSHQLSSLSILIANPSLLVIKSLHLISFVVAPTIRSPPSASIRWFAKGTPKLPSILTTVIKLSYHLCVFCILPLRPPNVHRPLVREVGLANVLKLFAKTGTLIAVLLPASIDAGTTPVVSAESHTELATQSTVSEPCSVVGANAELEEVQKRVMEAIAGPRHLLGKRKINEDINLPRFCRGYAWTDRESSFFSPSAHYSISAPPLPSPPAHLLNNPSIQLALDRYRSTLKVETPFDITKFASLLDDHPNRPFVESVISGLRYGFWPLDDGEWDMEKDGEMKNYPAEEDLAAIREFRDKELSSGRRSGPIHTFLPGMQISPLFVNWRNPLKPPVITDHSASGLNDGIPKAEAKVRYDDMHDFGQILHDIHQQFKGRRFVLYKSDVASAFLNLPAHPIWQ